MKRFVILLTACFLILASARACGAKPKDESPKPQVFLFLLIQCELPLAFVFMASDGSSRYVGMDDREALNQITAQVPKANWYGIALPDPEAGCPLPPDNT